MQDSETEMGGGGHLSRDQGQLYSNTVDGQDRQLHGD
jgi:hypothetical protein